MAKRIILTVTNDLVYDQRMQRICSSLKKNGFFVELVGRIMVDSKPVNHEPYLQTRLKCFFTKGFLFYAEFNIRLFLYLLLNGFDVVCGCDLDTLPAALLAAKLKGRKVVYDAHEYFTQSPELIGRPVKQSIWLFLENILLPGVDDLYTVTHSIARLFNDKYHKSCKVVHNYPNKQEDLLPSSDGRYLLYQGAVNIGRGLNELLLAMLSVEEMSLYIAGDGDDMQRIQKSVIDLKLEDKVKLLGRQTPNQLKQITKDALIGINLLENRGLSYYYSLGNKTFDYIQAGVPQILIGFPEYIALNEKYNIGVIVDSLSVDKIEQAIHLLLNDKTLYNQLRQNCLDARAQLCWESEEKQLIQIYNNLVN